MEKISWRNSGEMTNNLKIESKPKSSFLLKDDKWYEKRELTESEFQSL